MKQREWRRGLLGKNQSLFTVILWVASLILIASAFMGWLVTPLQGNIKAYSFPFMENAPLSIAVHNPVQIRSFGVMVFALGLLGTILVTVRPSPRAFFCLGGIAAIVCLSFLGNITFLNSQMIESILDQTRQAQNIKVFSQKYLSGNARYLSPYKHLTTDTLLRKTEVGIRYLGLGWYVALIGTLVILVASYRKQAGKSMKWDAGALTLILLIVTATLVARTVKAEYNRIQGDYYLAQGELQRAIGFYESAARWDPNLNSNSGYAHNLGAAYYRLGWHNRPETHIYLGDIHMAERLFSEAIHEYKAASGPREYLALANRKWVDALITMGLDNYSKGKIYTALSNWQQALQLDPSDIQAHFFLAKALSDINAQDQSKALAQARAILDKTKDQLVKADIYNLLGDMYYKQQDFVMAREMYSLSRAQYHLVKKIINFGAMKGLQGI